MTTLDVPSELRSHEQYEVLRELGRGGMGVVYLARNRLMKRLEVLKVVNPQLLDRPDTRARFLREISSAAQLHDPHIVTAYSASQLGSLLVLALEYVEGENLAEVVERAGPLPVVNACYYLQQAALGLQHAYEQGMVHRDIKPHNLILGQKGNKPIVKILDFGLAKLTNQVEATSGKLTQAGATMGTALFMAPEQIKDAASADIRADIYSLGCTAYYLLAARPPFETMNQLALLHAHLELEPGSLHEVRREVPVELAAVVAKMMAKEPAQRYQQPVEVARALAPFVRGGLKPLPPAPDRSAAASVEKNSGRAKERVPSKDLWPTTPAHVETDSGHAQGKQQARRPAPVPRPTQIEVEGSATDVRRQAPSRAAGGSGKWLLAGGIGVTLLVLFGAVGLLLSGVFRVKTPEGILVLKVNEPNPDVYVDGDKVTVTWGKDGKTAEVRVKPGTRKVEVKKDGFTASGDEVEILDGTRSIFTATLVSQGPNEPGPKPIPPADVGLVARVKNASGIDLVAIPSGWFHMGSKANEEGALDDEKPRYKVTITQSFYLGKYKVTVGQFRRFVDATGYKTEAEQGGNSSTWKDPGFVQPQTDDHPVVYVSWNDASAYCQWLAKETGAKARLPREAEWEYSCRAQPNTAMTTRYYFGDNDANLGEYAWFSGNSGGTTHPCGQKKPNAFDLYDMHGLAFEWCADGKRTYENKDETDPEGPSSAGASRVCRGGWFNSAPRNCRAAFRNVNAPSNRFGNLGFRVLVVR